MLKLPAARTMATFDGSLKSMAELVREPTETHAEASRRLVKLVAGEPDMEKLRNVVAYRERKREDLDLEVCLSRAGIGRSEAFGIVCRVLHRYAFDLSRVVTALAMANHAPQVAEALCLGASALEGGERDRQTFYQMAGMLRQGGGVSVQVNATAEAAAGAKLEASDPRGLPNFEEQMKEIGTVVRVLDVPRAG
jgi:hypothetical protein